MSSAILTESRADRADQARPEPDTGSKPSPSAGTQAWRFLALTALILAVATGIALRNHNTTEVALAMLTVLASGAVAITIYRTLYPLTHSDELHSSVLIGGRTRAALERDKALTLRAIKELEFDHAMKKVADADFDEVRQRLRTRAMRLMRQLEGTSGYRNTIEQDLGRMLVEAPAAVAPTGRTCGECGAGNESDARFCKMCGRSLQIEAGR